MSTCTFCVNPALDDEVPKPMCSPCWEVHHRVKDLPIKVLNSIVADARGYGYFKKASVDVQRRRRTIDKARRDASDEYTLRQSRVADAKRDLR